MSDDLNMKESGFNMNVDKLIESLIHEEDEGMSRALKVSCHLIAVVHLGMAGVEPKNYRGVLPQFLEYAEARDQAIISMHPPKYELKETLSKFISGLQEFESFREVWKSPFALGWFISSENEVAEVWLDEGVDMFLDAAYFCEDPERHLLLIEAAFRKDLSVPLFEVILEEVRVNRVKVAAQLRRLLPAVELHQALALINLTPVRLLESAQLEQANNVKSLLEALGAKVSIRPMDSEIKK